MKKFIEPYYADKDIMHSMWHIELVERQMNKIIEMGNYSVNYEYLYLILGFHGFIYKDEQKIKEWWHIQGYSNEAIALSLKSTSGY